MGSKYTKDIQDDLQTLRKDVGNLAEQLTALLSDKGDELTGDVKQRMQKIRENIDEALSEVSAKGREIVSETRLDGLGETIENSVRERPFTMLAIAVGLGAVVGSQLRR